MTDNKISCLIVSSILLTTLLSGCISNDSNKESLGTLVIAYEIKDNFENSAVEEKNPHKLHEQFINVDILYGFESELKLNDPESRKKVDKLKHLISKGGDDVLPAILVRYNAKEGKELQVVDGHHRYWAYKELSEENNFMKKVKVRIVPDYMIKEVMFKEDLPEQFL